MISGHAMVDFLFTHYVFQLSCCPYKWKTGTETREVVLTDMRCYN